MAGADAARPAGCSPGGDGSPGLRQMHRRAVQQQQQRQHQHQQQMEQDEKGEEEQKMPAGVDEVAAGGECGLHEGEQLGQLPE